MEERSETCPAEIDCDHEGSESVYIVDVYYSARSLTECRYVALRLPQGEMIY